ncbi:hypothetical protein [Pseudomonas syringae]|uniref:Uncharacterized protein n=1 Tax=Pseudomonas syringae TaxID=317 RepID=A0AB38C211_PSESX|nr:hypothetical protein [Pseudomonas syringae]MCK0550820.1 hypothetical protein [Pseudomonas syringae pv. aptata]RXT84683.1 hypothetical protein B1F69_25315 [Pseudomonas syringae]SFO59777.1 hypothetical protein SAMN05444065_1461 [Pseudomonas syringae]SFP05257.1 hypothetical protein SAMN05444063_14613 [Pseudomonas syringae]
MMPDFVIGDFKQVRELDHDALVNAHLADGWVLLLVRPGVDVGNDPVTGNLQSFPVTVYVIGFRGEGGPKMLSQYQSQVRDPDMPTW